MSFPSTYPGTLDTRKKFINGGAKVGTTAGWVVNAANDIGRMATIPAGVTAGTLVVPLNGLTVGDIIISVHLVGQIESAGNACTVDMDIRKLTAAAADLTDASLDTMTQLSVTADTIISEANASKTLTTPETLGANESLYVLITVTTAAATDVDLMGVAVTFKQAI